MLENIWFIAAVWMGLALAGSLFSIWTGISVALVEILIGVVVGNLAVGLEGGTLHISIAGAGASTGICITYYNRPNGLTSWHCSAAACSHFLPGQKSIRFR